jgi:membrane dipeptidase
MTETSVPRSEHAASLLADSLVIDGLAGHFVAPEPPVRDGKSFLQRTIDAGVNAVNITLAAHADSFDETLRMMFNYYCLIDHQRERALQVRSVSDIDRARSEGKVGFIFGTQYSGMVGGDTWRWTILYELGLRIAQLAYNERNILGDGCREPENRGLTAFGRQAVQEMNRLGIALDISHTGERTSLDAIAYSSRPVIASHSNARSVSPSDRNLADETMRAVASTGGVMGLSPHSSMCFRIPGQRPALSDYLDQFDYAIDLIGIDHVAVGTDLFESYTKISWESSTKRMYPSAWIWETMYADGFQRVEDWARLVDGLIDRGYSDEALRQILGGNWYRVLGEIWDPSATTRADRGWAAVMDTQAVGAVGSSAG